MSCLQDRHITSMVLVSMRLESYPMKPIFGSFLPDELPSALEGSFGLVWDGDSSKTCSGVFGEYLRYNNSHKASLYLASGFPIIVVGAICFG